MKSYHLSTNNMLIGKHRTLVMNLIRPQKRYFKVGDKEFCAGDIVTVFRSSGARETDWTLKSFGKGNAVVERPNTQGGTDRKVPTIAEFMQWQIATPSGKINFDKLPPEGKTNIPSEEEIRRLTGL